MAHLEWRSRQLALILACTNLRHSDNRRRALTMRFEMVEPVCGAFPQCVRECGRRNFDM